MIYQREFHTMRDRRIRQAELVPFQALASEPSLISFRGLMVSALICTMLMLLLAVGK